MPEEQGVHICCSTTLMHSPGRMFSLHHSYFCLLPKLDLIKKTLLKLLLGYNHADKLNTTQLDSGTRLAGEKILQYASGVLTRFLNSQLTLEILPKCLNFRASSIPPKITNLGIQSKTTCSQKRQIITLNFLYNL